MVFLYRTIDCIYCNIEEIYRLWYFVNIVFTYLTLKWETSQNQLQQ